MRRVIKKRIRRTGDGIDLALDLNAVLAINDGAVEDEETDDVPPAPGEPGAPEGNDQGRSAT
jgi:hypothetical protein